MQCIYSHDVDDDPSRVIFDRDSRTCLLAGTAEETCGGRGTVISALLSCLKPVIGLDVEEIDRLRRALNHLIVLAPAISCEDRG